LVRYRTVQYSNIPVPYRYLPYLEHLPVLPM
jgi:hypothetical protein